MEVVQTGTAHAESKQQRGGYPNQQVATQASAVDQARYPTTAESLAQQGVPDNKARYVDDEGSTASETSTDEWTAVVDPDRYSACKRVGKGAYGAVMKAFDEVRKTYVAIKSHDGLFSDLVDAKRNLRELAILSRLHHPNIVNVHDVYVNKDWESFDDVFIVMDLCDIDLNKLITMPKTELSEYQTQWMTYNLLSGLAYLHSAGIYHRDLKPANCLVNKDCTLKICDFGLAAPIFEEEPTLLDEPALPQPARLTRKITAHVVTRYYRAPEVCLLQKRYDEMVDVWSAACILAEMLQLLPGTDYIRRSPLFEGSCCYPLSPNRRAPRLGRGHKADQLHVIIGLLGLPTKEDLEDLDDFQGMAVQQYIEADFKSFQEKSPEERRSALKLRVPGAEFKALDLMEKMLKFGPGPRATVHEALGHAFLAPVRDESSELLAPQRVRLAFEEEELCLESDDEEAGPRKLSVRHCFKQEILHFKSASACERSDLFV